MRHGNSMMPGSGSTAFLQPFVAALMLILLAPLSSFAVEPLKLSADELQGTYIGLHAEHLEDASRALTLEDVRKRGGFLPIRSKTIGFGVSNSAHWLRLPVNNPAAGELHWVLQAEHPLLNHIQVFEVYPSGVKSHESGNMLPYRLREIPYRKYAFNLQSPPGESELFIRIWPEKAQAMNCTFTAWSPASFSSAASEGNLVLGLYFGAMMVMALYNLFVFLSVRHVSYLWYVAYLIGVIFAHLGLNGFIYQSLLSEATYMVQRLPPMAPLFVAYGFAALFARSFLGTKERMPRIDRALTAVAFLCAGAFITFILLLLPYRYLTRIAYPVVTILPLFFIFVGVLALAKGVRQARFFVGGWSVFLVGTVILALRDQGGLPHNLITTYSMQTGTLIEVVLLSFALGDRINILRREKETAEAVLMGHLTNSKIELEKKVTERTAELKESEDRYRNLSDSSFEGILVHDQGIILDVNEALLQMTGFSRQELVGNDLLELLVPEEYWEIVKRNVASGREAAYEIVGKRKDGAVTHLEIRGRPVQFHGRAARVAAVRDITEHKKAENALREAKEMAEEATKLKDKFVTMVSHDIRSPLASEGVALQAMASSRTMEDDDRRLIEKMVANNQNMMDMMNRLLDISRLQTGKIKPARKYLSCHRLVERCIDQTKQLAEKKGVILRNSISTGMKVFADPDLIGACISNLLTNAIKFSHSGGMVAVNSPHDNPRIIAVSDQGVGVAKALMPKLFNAELKTTKIGTSGEKGTGLGLPYCHDIMIAHGGTITVESEEGKGSAFYLSFPDVKPSVMVVDDQEVARATVRDYLKGIGVEVVEAEDGRSALDLLMEFTPQLIITDLNMPNVNGFDLIKAIKGNHEKQRIPIIAATSSDAWQGLGGEDSSTRALELGADDFVNKPFSETDLVPRVKKFLGR